MEFQAKILARSGLGDETSLPPNLAENPPAISMSDARWEFEQVGVVGVDLLRAVCLAGSRAVRA